jgi:branched-chain amino acid transport system permease protein
MSDFVFFLTTGICAGAVYGLVALGYSMVYGVIKLVNFAHGEIYMTGAYTGFAVYMFLPKGLPLWVSVPFILAVSGAAGALAAYLMETVAYRPVRHSGRLAPLLTALGVSFFLQNAAAFINRGDSLSYPADTPGSIGYLCQTSVAVGGGGVKTAQIALVFLSAALTFALWLFIMKTRFGAAMRAVSQDSHAASLMGVSVRSVVSATFVIGGFLAGIAGSLVAFQSIIEPMMGFMPGLKAFIAAVIGGIGSVPGAFAGGILLGVIENLSVWLGVPTGFKDIVCFLTLIAFLLIRPSGIFGGSGREKV